jgi:hypothetical protein
VSRADAAAHIAGTIHIDEIEGGPESLLTNCGWALRHAAIPHYFTTEREFAYLLVCLRGELSFSQWGKNAAIHAAHGGLRMTRAQRRQLIACLYFRDRRMSVAALMLFNWRGFAIFLVLSGATVAAALLVGSHLMAWVFGAAYAGMILRHRPLRQGCAGVAAVEAAAGLAADRGNGQGDRRASRDRAAIGGMNVRRSPGYFPCISSSPRAPASTTAWM